jgi:hypothetical protein
VKRFLSNEKALTVGLFCFMHWMGWLNDLDSPKWLFGAFLASIWLFMTLAEIAGHLKRGVDEGLEKSGFIHASVIRQEALLESLRDTLRNDAIDREIKWREWEDGKSC